MLLGGARWLQCGSRGLLRAAGAPGSLLTQQLGVAPLAQFAMRRPSMSSSGAAAAAAGAAAAGGATETASNAGSSSKNSSSSAAAAGRHAAAAAAAPPPPASAERRRGGGGGGSDSDGDSDGAAAAAAASTSPSDSRSDAAILAAAEALPAMRLALPPPASAQVKSAEFVRSSVRVDDCPPPRWPEFAVIGRSNVGKSSLINMLTGRKALALVSKEPGKTRCINHFLVNGAWYLVDLPGYGYARTGREQRRDFDAFTRAYLQQRPTLVMVLLLVDSSVPPQRADLEYAAWLGARGVPFSVVFTKADKKRRKGAPRRDVNMAAFKLALVRDHGFVAVPPCLVTSAAAGAGKPELLGFIASLRVAYESAAGGGGK